jgi:transposase
MYKIKLTKTELKKLERLQSKGKSNRINRRAQAIVLAAKGRSYQDIAEVTGVCVDTVTAWIKLYNDKKLAGLCEFKFKDKRKSKINDYVEQIKQDVKDNTISTLAEMQAWIKEKYSIEMEQSWLFRCCKKNSIYLTRKPA